LKEGNEREFFSHLKKPRPLQRELKAVNNLNRSICNFVQKNRSIFGVYKLGLLHERAKLHIIIKLKIPGA